MIYTIKQLSHLLRCSPEEMDYITNHLKAYYYHHESNKIKYGFPQLDSKGEPRKRDLWPCRGSLKRIQHRLAGFLQQQPFPCYMYGGIKKRNNIQNALQHVNSKYFLSVDLKDFFPNITHRQVFKMLLSRGCPPEIAGMITKLTTYMGNLKQGPSTSPVIANMVFMATAAKLHKIAEENSLIFTNYFDDQSFSSRSDFKVIVPTILEEIKQGGFTLNQKKINYKTHFPEVTGIFIYKRKLLLNPTIKNYARINPSVRTYEQRVAAANQSGKA